ncbi:ABC transporter A family member 12-like protein [Drosera capensis]
MAEEEARGRRAGFCNQAHALIRKNLIYQKRQRCETLTMFLTPLVVIAFLRVMLKVTESSDSNVSSPLNCNYSLLQYGVDPYHMEGCEYPSPQKWPPMLRIAESDDRAVRTSFMSYSDLPDKSCRKVGSCPVTVLITGSNQTLGQGVAGKMFTDTSLDNFSISQGSLPELVLGSTAEIGVTYLFDRGFESRVYAIQKYCSSSSTFSVPFLVDSEKRMLELGCIQGLDLWRNSSSEIDDELFRGYFQGNTAGQTNEIAAAYDFQNSDENIFNAIIWYNSSDELSPGLGGLQPQLIRFPRLVNLASNAYLHLLRGPGTKMIFDFIKEMPTRVFPPFDSGGGFSLFQWISPLALVMQFQVVAKAIVYEKQRNIRIMMKMHGLGDRPYWTFVFFFLYANLQVSLSFLAAALCSNIRTVTVVNLLVIFVGFAAAGFLFGPSLKNPAFPSRWILCMELFPFFALYRALYEFEQYAIRASQVGHGMQWKDLGDNLNGLKDVMIIMIIECFVFLMITYYVDQVKRTGSGVKKGPLFFLRGFRKKHSSSTEKPSLEMQRSHDSPQMEKFDIAQEREKVEQLMLESSASHAIICNNLRKVYPGRDGNPEKVAVKGVSLAMTRAECFGMLGPNGAGKTSFIGMMIGLTEPTSGTSLVQGLDIRSSMDDIYGSMGVCPQHDLLWDCLTGREHLLFYGRLKNLKGVALKEAVKDSLLSLNLYKGGVADREAGKYSGGMKRRLSVAISLIGDPKVVYMDEPSTGLDPASRSLLWGVVKRAKQDRAIILTTHSMEEAEALCDRLGIFVNGELQCLKARYGGTFVFTMTTTADHDAEVEEMVHAVCANAKKIYHLAGTQKFELPKHEVRVSNIFELVENAKRKFTVNAWGLADTTLEDVFIKVTREAEESVSLR